MSRPELPYKSWLTTPPLAIILGLNEVASAVAVAMHHAGYGVVMSHDPNPPVLRRGMSFFDVLHHDRVVIEGIEGLAWRTPWRHRPRLHGTTRSPSRTWG